jgi:hypothetical protein
MKKTYRNMFLTNQHTWHQRSEDKHEIYGCRDTVEPRPPGAQRACDKAVEGGDGQSDDGVKNAVCRGSLVAAVPVQPAFYEGRAGGRVGAYYSNGDTASPSCAGEIKGELCCVRLVVTQI